MENILFLVLITLSLSLTAYSAIYSKKTRWKEIEDQFIKSGAITPDKAIRLDDPELVKSIKKNFVKTAVVNQVNGDMFWFDIVREQKRRKNVGVFIGVMIGIGISALSGILIILLG